MTSSGRGDDYSCKGGSQEKLNSPYWVEVGLDKLRTSY